MSPRQGKAWLRRVIATGAVVAATVAAIPACAVADEVATPTTQATAYNADWVPYLDPPEKPAAVCLVDSGVNITPDTPADSPEGPILKRLSLDGGPGTAANTTWEGLHGTRMAFVGGAPINGWGAVGFWPGVRIVSIRAMPQDRSTFPFDNYSHAVGVCTKDAATQNIAVINLSLGCTCAPTGDEQSRLDAQIDKAHENGANVVASAGNNGGAAGSPANEPGVFAVAAGSATGALCPFSSRGADIDLIAPGCDVDLADPDSGQLWSSYQSGTSGASMTISAILALLRSYRPSLDWIDAESLLTSSARATAAGPAINVERLFDASGLSGLVGAARARMPAQTPPSAESLGTSDAPTTTALPDANELSAIDLDAGTSTPRQLVAPRLRAIYRRGSVLTASVRNFPRGSRLVVALQSRRREFNYVTVAHRVVGSSPVTLRVPRRWRGGRLVLRYESRRPTLRSSAQVYRVVSR